MKLPFQEFIELFQGLPDSLPKELRNYPQNFTGYANSGRELQLPMFSRGKDASDTQLKYRRQSVHELGTLCFSFCGVVVLAPISKETHSNWDYYNEMYVYAQDLHLNYLKSDSRTGRFGLDNMTAEAGGHFKPPQGERMGTSDPDQDLDKLLIWTRKNDAESIVNCLNCDGKASTERDMALCPSCAGTGDSAGSQCSSCEGLGEISTASPMFQPWSEKRTESCHVCELTGSRWNPEKYVTLKLNNEYFYSPHTGVQAAMPTLVAQQLARYKDIAVWFQYDTTHGSGKETLIAMGRDKQYGKIMFLLRPWQLSADVHGYTSRSEEGTIHLSNFVQP